MKTHIFFDTNKLEIFDGKDYSKFQFSHHYNEVLKFIQKYDLKDKVELYVSQIVIEEMIKHYKEYFKTDFDNAKKEIEKINNAFGATLIDTVNFDPKYDKRKYFKFIKQNSKRYIKKTNINVIPYPEKIESIIKRSLQGKNPFHIQNINGKKHKDGGFKDVIIWESILNTEFNKNDVVILYSDDNDFEEDKLKNDLRVKHFKIAREFKQLEEIILNAYNINEKYFSVLKYVTSEYFSEWILKEVAIQVKNKYDYREIIKIHTNRKNIKVINVTHNDIHDLLVDVDPDDKYQSPIFFQRFGRQINKDYLKVIVPVKINYNDYKIKKIVQSQINIECISDLTDIISISYPGSILTKNKIILGDLEKKHE